MKALVFGHTHTWKLGKDGDFRYISGDPFPWFSHQHDPQLLADDVSLLVFDNLRHRLLVIANAHITKTDPASLDRAYDAAAVKIGMLLGNLRRPARSAGIRGVDDDHDAGGHRTVTVVRGHLCRVSAAGGVDVCRRGAGAPLRPPSDPSCRS